MTSDDSSSAVERCTMVLQACASRSQSVRDLAERIGVSKSAVHRVLSSLEAVGFLSFSEQTRRYSLGEGVLQLASAYPRASELVGPLREPLIRLSSHTSETVCLHLAVGWKRMTVFQCESSQDLRYATTVGRLFPLHAGAAGRVLLSLFPDGELEQYLASGKFERHTNRTVTDPGTLRDLVQRARADGYAVTRGEHIKGAAGIAVPLQGNSGRRLALSVFGPLVRLDRARTNRVVEMLVGVADECLALMNRSQSRQDQPDD